MAAVIRIYECSASMAGTNKTSSTIRFKLADDATVDNQNPLTIPSSGAAVTRSYSKHIRFYCATAPSVYIDNLRAYADGTNSFGTGITLVGSNVGATYTTNSTAAVTNATNVFLKTSGSPWNLDAVHTASVVATGFFGDIIKLQMVVASDAAPGALSTETLSYVYDEI